MGTKKDKHQEQAAVAAAPAVRKVLLSVEETAEATGLGRTTVFRLLQEGQLQGVKVGKRRLVPVAEIEAFALRLQKGA